VLFIDNLLVRVHFTIVMIRWTGLAPWEFEFFFQVALHLPPNTRRAGEEITYGCQKGNCGACEVNTKRSTLNPKPKH